MSMTRIPDAVTEEHEEIFSGLRTLAETKSLTGASIRDLLGVLEPHFEKEEELAMPLLGAVEAISKGRTGNGFDEVISLGERLSDELPSMLAEHRAIGDRIAKASKAAGEEGNQTALSLLSGLRHHARIEEEVLYPAAILAGMAAKAMKEVVRVRAA